MSYKSTQYLIGDNSTLAHYIGWGSALSAALAAMGWIQGNDTGQVVWTATVMTCTQVAVAGPVVTYSYSSYTGPEPRVGMSVTFSGFGGTGNNTTVTLTGVSGGSSGTVTAVYTAQTNTVSAGSGTTTAVASIPSSNFTTNYEIWGPGDAGTQFWLRIGYGYSNPNIGISCQLGTSTNGAGTLTGYTTTLFSTSQPGQVSSTAAAACSFSGDTNRFGAMMWTTTAPAVYMFIERTKNVDGTDSSEGVTIWNSCYNVIFQQQTIVFGVGAAQNWTAGWAVIQGGSPSSDLAFNNNVPVFPSHPVYGKLGNPATVCCLVPNSDIAAWCFFTTTLYGVTRTYLSAGAANGVNRPAGNNSVIAMRYD